MKTWSLIKVSLTYDRCQLAPVLTLACYLQHVGVSFELIVHDSDKQTSIEVQKFMFVMCKVATKGL